VTVPRGAWFEYKYTRGGWPSVEKYPGCVEAKNRYAFGAVHTASLDVAGKQDTVWAWADVCP
jgi:alpha-glucosidase